MKRGGQVRAFILSGAHAKDGLYLLWACGHGPIGLANRPIGLARPYLIFYPLHYPLAGKIKDDLCIDCNDEGAYFVDAQVNVCLSEFLSQPDLQLLHKFLPCELILKELDVGT